MESGNQSQGGLVPHGAIFDIKWEVHQRLPDGQFTGSPTDAGHLVCTIHAIDRSLAVEYARSIIDIIKEKVTNVNSIEINEERLGKSRVQGVGGPRSSLPELLGMRGTIGGNPSG